MPGVGDEANDDNMGLSSPIEKMLADMQKEMGGMKSKINTMEEEKWIVCIPTV